MVIVRAHALLGLAFEDTGWCRLGLMSLCIFAGRGGVAMNPTRGSQTAADMMVSAVCFSSYAHSAADMMVSADRIHSLAYSASHARIPS